MLAEVCKYLPMDGFHYPRCHLQKMDDPAEAMARRGAPFTFDSKGLLRLLREIKASKQLDLQGGRGEKNNEGERIVKKEEKRKRSQRRSKEERERRTDRTQVPMEIYIHNSMQLSLPNLTREVRREQH